MAPLAVFSPEADIRKATSFQNSPASSERGMDEVCGARR